MSPIQTIYKGRLPCKAVPSLDYGISRIMCQGSSLKNDSDLNIWSRKVFPFFGASILIREKRTNSLTAFVAEISIKKSISILSVIKHMVFDHFQIWSRFDLSPELRIGTFGLKSFFSFFGATFQTTECSMASIGCFLVDISHKKSISTRNGTWRHSPFKNCLNRYWIIERPKI